MPYWERRRHCWLSDGRLMGIFASPSLDGGLIIVRVLIRGKDGKDRQGKTKIIVCEHPE